MLAPWEAPESVGRLARLHEAACDSPCLMIDFGGCGRDDVFTAYQELGVLCFAGARPRRLLLRAGREEAESHYALRDVLSTVARMTVCGSLEMSIALVTSSRATAQVGHALRAALVPLGCRLRVFPAERRARRWLEGDRGLL